jgi:nitrite reductase (NO-forming)
MANGMYGAIIVDPAEPLPPADVSYVLVQSEWYTAQDEGTLMLDDYDKMLTVRPDEVVFNGIAFQYNDHPLTAKVGQRVRLYVINAGPNLGSAFHIIGGMFAAVYPDADAKHALSGVSTYPIAPGQGVVFDAIITQAGKYPIVDHYMRNMEIGAAGALEVTP